MLVVFQMFDDLTPPAFIFWTFLQIMVVNLYKKYVFQILSRSYPIIVVDYKSHALCKKQIKHTYSPCSSDLPVPAMHKQPLTIKFNVFA